MKRRLRKCEGGGASSGQTFCVARIGSIGQSALSWWGRIEVWGTYITVKVSSFFSQVLHRNTPPTGLKNHEN